MKNIYRAQSDLVAQRFGTKAAGEQEILLTLADAAIEIFALESAVLRAEKASATASDSRQALYRAVAMACAFRSRQRFAMAAEKCAACIGDDAMFASIGKAINYSGAGMLAAKRLIADAISEAERYIF
jgi:hypothetical protein